MARGGHPHVFVTRTVILVINDLLNANSAVSTSRNDFLKKRKTAAEFQKRYRARKKTKHDYQRLSSTYVNF